MIWQEFKTEWGSFSWELSPLSQLTPLGPAGRAHKYSALNVLPSVFVTLLHNWDCSRDDGISPAPASCPLLLSDFPSRGADFTPHPGQTSGKPRTSWAVPQLGGINDSIRWHTAPAGRVNKINLQEIQERWFPSMELPHLLKLAHAQCTHCVSCQPGFRQILWAGQGIDLLHRTKSLSSPSISWTLSFWSC